jgi:hypothetical protein
MTVWGGTSEFVDPAAVGVALPCWRVHGNVTECKRVVVRFGGSVLQIYVVVQSEIASMIAQTVTRGCLSACYL